MLLRLSKSERYFNYVKHIAVPLITFVSNLCNLLPCGNLSQTECQNCPTEIFPRLATSTISLHVRVRGRCFAFHPSHQPTALNGEAVAVQPEVWLSVWIRRLLKRP